MQRNVKNPIEYIAIYSRECCTVNLQSVVYQEWCWWRNLTARHVQDSSFHDGAPSVSVFCRWWVSTTSMDNSRVLVCLAKMTVLGHWMSSGHPSTVLALLTSVSSLSLPQQTTPSKMADVTMISQMALLNCFWLAFFYFLAKSFWHLEASQRFTIIAFFSANPLAFCLRV